MDGDGTVVVKSAALPKIFNETTKYAAATGLAAIYICGYLITTLNDAKYGFYDSELLRPKIITAGLVFAIAVGYPLYILAVTGNLCKITKPNPTTLDRLAAFSSYLVILNALIAFSTIFTMGICEPQFQSPHPWKLILWSAADLTACVIFSTIYSNLTQMENLVRISIASSIIISGCVGLYLGYLATVGSWHSPQYAWAYGVAMASLIDTNVDIGDFEKFKKYPWLRTTIQCMLVMWFFSQLIYPHLRPFFGGALEDITITTQQNLGMSRQPIKVKLIDASAEGYYVLLDSGQRATYFPRSSIERIDYR